MKELKYFDIKETRKLYKCHTDYFENEFKEKLKSFVYSLYLKNLGGEEIKRIRLEQSGLIRCIMNFDPNSNGAMNQAKNDILHFLQDDFTILEPYLTILENLAKPYLQIFGEFTRSESMHKLLLNYYDGWKTVKEQGIKPRFSKDDFALFAHSVITGPKLEFVKENCLKIPVFKINDVVNEDFFKNPIGNDKTIRSKFSIIDNALLFYSSEVYKSYKYAEEDLHSYSKLAPDILYFLSKLKKIEDIEFDLDEKSHEILSHMMLNHDNDLYKKSVKLKILFESAFASFNGELKKSSLSKLRTYYIPVENKDDEDILLPKINYTPKEPMW